MRCWKLVGIALSAIVAIVAVYVVVGGYNVAADEPHWGVTTSLLATLRDRSIAARAAGVEVPADLDNPIRVDQGGVLYAEMCADCHLAPGVIESEIRKGLNPMPPNLAKDPIRSPKQAFWTISHGVKMTGMPAWGKSHSNEQIWNLVAFLRQIANLTPERYRALTAKAQAGDHGHETGHSH